MTSDTAQPSLRLIAKVLDRKDKFRLAISVLLILIGTVLEMASLSVVIPVVQSVVGGDRRSNYQWIPRYFETISYSAFIQVLVILLVAVFVVKNAFNLLSNYYQQRVQLSIYNRIVQQLFEAYLRQPYEFHLVNSSSVLVRNVQEYSSAIANSGVGPLLTLTSDVITGVGLLIILVVVEPVGTAVLVILFLVSSTLILSLTKNRIRRWGAERIRHRGILLESLMAGFGGIKEIKLFGRDAEVVRTHKTSLREAARSFYLFHVLQGVPRAVFEVVAVSGVAALVIIASLGDKDLADTSLIVALFGVVAFRMLPSVNRMIQSLQQLTFARPGIVGAIDGLSRQAQDVDGQPIPIHGRFERLEVRELRYLYPNSKSSVLEIDELIIEAGDSLGIVGSSGAGKSTLLDMIIGILTPSSGQILLNGNDIRANVRGWQDRIGYVPQHVYLMDTTIRRNVAFGLHKDEISDSQVESALHRANLWDFVRGLPDGLDTEVGERGVRLSGGQRQRLGIARAVYSNPEVLVLDEATSSLDTDTERQIVESFNEIADGCTLIVVAHRTTTLVNCSRIVQLRNGQIVKSGSYSEFASEARNSSIEKN